jgi:hypothetical protein
MLQSRINQESLSATTAFPDPGRFAKDQLILAL